MEALRFTGSGSEYFKIWIVNVLLTIITLGMYYPWAKVRNRLLAKLASKPSYSYQS